MAAAQPQLSDRMRLHAHKVDLQITVEDGMVSSDTHYLSVGASALDSIIAAVSLGGRPDPARILDFGSGAGRVTRWLKAVYPEAHLSCCDLRSQDVSFCHEAFAAEAWISGTDVETLDFRGCYDLIWIGSVLTHLEERVSRRLVDQAMAVLNPGGLLVATTLGRAGRAIQDKTPIFLEGAGWDRVKRHHDETGYGYVDYEGQAGYGLSLSSLAWVTTLATRCPGRRLVMMSEQAWDGLQDVFALQAESSFKADPAELIQSEHKPYARESRVASLEKSTSWKITAPLRRIVRYIRTVT